MLERFFNRPDRWSFALGGRVYAGPGARLDVPDLVRDHAPVLAVVDRAFLEDPLVAALDPIRTIRVDHEPRQDDLDALGTELQALSPAPRAVVALGGGSAIDSAKALYARLVYGTLTPRDVLKRPGAPVLIAIPTTAGSGAEASRFAVMAERGSGRKLSVRAWGIAPDLAVLDPETIRHAGQERLTLGAFDSFIHLLETYLARGERGPMTDMLAREGIGLIAHAVARMSLGARLDTEHLIGLQRASWMGGAAIASVRTGLMHTLGESLAEQSALSHPETLIVFFEDALTPLRGAPEARLVALDAALKGQGAGGFDDLITAWHALFGTLSIRKRITETLSREAIDLDRLVETAARDTVLHKEHPFPLTTEDLRWTAQSALIRFGAIKTPTPTSARAS